jgi:hypothetical protein
MFPIAQSFLGVYVLVSRYAILIVFPTQTKV